MESQKKDLRQYELCISGRVQGVGFRSAARNEARKLGLKGWVENLPDGSVHALIQGDDLSCKQFIRWCYGGNAFSWTEKVDLQEKPLDQLTSFQIRF